MEKRALFVAAILVTSSVPAQAQMPTEHKIGLGLYATAATLDYHSTYLVLSTPGGFERNPLGRLTQHDPAATVIAGAAIDAVAVPLLYKWLGKRHPALTTVLLVSASSVRLTLASWNYREYRRYQQRMAAR